MSSTGLAELPIFERVDERYRRLPSCLKSWRIWYPSRFKPRKDGVSFDKPPCNKYGKPTGHDKPNWMSFDEAVGLDMDGVGIMLHEELGLTGIDFDHCVKDGVIIDPWVAQKIKELNSYTEYSVSGTGIHVLVWGALPSDKRVGKIEMYDGSGSRFLVMTGNLVPGTPTEIRNAQDTINALHIEVFGSELEKTAPLQNQQLNPKCYTSFHKKKKREGEEGDSQLELRPANELTQNLQVRFDNLRDKRPNFASTWEMSRATSQWPFPSGRYTSSEYELSIASFLAADGWDAQEIMDFICVWRRKHGLKDPVNYSRYACTISKAIATAIPRLNGSGYTRKESKGLYRHAQTKERILGCIIETPKSPADIAQELNLIPSHVRAVLTRLHKNDKVIRSDHSYLCSPHAVPSYLQNIPDDAGDDIGVDIQTPADAEISMEELEVEYQKYVAEMEDEPEPVEEEIEAPLGFPMPAAAAPGNPGSDWEAFLAEYVGPEPVTQPAEAPYIFTWPVGAVEEVYVGGNPLSRGEIDSYRAATAAWEIGWNKEKRECQRKARAQGNGAAQLKRRKLAKGYASRLLPTAVDLEFRRLMETYRPPPDEDTNPF